MYRVKRIIFIFFLYLGTAAGLLHAQGSWTAFVTNLGGSPPQAASFLNEKFGFVETAGNWYRTTDGGKNWVLTYGLGVQGLLHLNFYYNTPDNIIVNGAFESINGGLTWQKWGNPSLSESIYEKDNILYDANGRRSFDHAGFWSQIIGYSDGEAMVGNLDKGIAMWGGQGFGIPPGSTLFTIDGGVTWHIGQTGIESDFGYAFPFTLTYLRAGGDGNDHILRTTDGGATWQSVFSQLQNSWYLTDGIKGDGCVVFVQTDSTHLSPAGVLRSTDQGATWVGIGGPTCTDDAPVCGVGSRGAVCFAMDYFKNGKNTLWKYTDPSLLRSVFSDMTIDRLFPDTLFMKACDTSEIKVKLHFSACDFIRFHDLRVDSLGAQNYESFFSADNIIRTGYPDSGTIALMPIAPGIYHLQMHIYIGASDWAVSDTTLPFVLVVKGYPPILKITVDDTVNFGAEPICVSGSHDSLLLSNPSCEPLTVTQIRFEADSGGLSAYSVSMPVPYDIIRGSPDGKIIILYHPKSAGIKTGKIIIVTTIGNDTISVYADALPDTAKLTITKNTPIDFGTEPLCLAGGKDTVFLSDSSCISLRVSSIRFEADSSPSSEFSLGTIAPYDLQFGKPAGRFIVNFHPLTSGIKTGKIIIKTSIGNDTIPVFANILPDGRTLALNCDSIQSPICDSSEGMVTIHNLSCRQMSLDSLALQSPFSLAPKQLPVVINSGDSTTLRIRFAPSLRGLQKITGVASLRLYLPGGTIVFDTTLNLVGFGLRGASGYSLTNNAVAFDTISLCDSAKHRFALYSTGCDSLPLSTISISGDPDFTYSVLSTQPSALAVGDSVVLNVSLNPTSIGNKSATITIALSDSSKVTVPISAIVVRSLRILSSDAQSIIDFGKQLTCENSDTIISLHNPGCDTVRVSGVGFQGSGFGTNTSFPIIIPPGESRIISLQTILDTSGGAISNSVQLTFNSDADNMLPSVTLTRSYIYPHPVHLWLDADMAPLTSLSVWKVKLKALPNEVTDVRIIDLAINYNTDLLGYFSKPSGANTVNSSDGKSFTISGSPMIVTSGDSSIAEFNFNVCLTKDTATSLAPGTIMLNSDPKFTGCVAIPQAVGLNFIYLNSCGDRSIRSFMRGLPLQLSIRPNPAQNEIELDLHSSINQDALVEIFDALGAKVFSDARNLTSGANSIHLATGNYSQGVYLVRINAASGSVSQAFVKVK
jgi:hypothetical protein